LDSDNEFISSIFKKPLQRLITGWIPMRRESKHLVLRRMPAFALLHLLTLAGFVVQAEAQTPTSANIVSTQNPSRVGDTVDFSVVVSGTGGTPTGTVTLSPGDGTSVASRLSGNRAMIHHTYLSAGFFLVTATYDGDAANLPSAGAIAQNVRKAVTTTTLGSLPNPASVGQSVAFAATVSATSGTPTGTVTFDFGDGSSASGPLAAGTATVSHTYTSMESFTVTATYKGDAASLTSVGTTEQNVGIAKTAIFDTQPDPGRDGSWSSSPPLFGCDGHPDRQSERQAILPARPRAGIDERRHSLPALCGMLTGMTLQDRVTAAADHRWFASWRGPFR
jgi:Bacterial Ig-like domain (group 3)